MEFERLKDKVIVISGGTKGVGRAFAEVAGREGASWGAVSASMALCVVVEGFFPLDVST